MQQFQPLRNDLPVQLDDAGDVAPWPAKARHETELDWIGTHFEDDRNGEKNAFRDAKAIAEAALRPTQRANNRPSPEAWR
jgi:hypothetical protein